MASLLGRAGVLGQRVIRCSAAKVTSVQFYDVHILLNGRTIWRTFATAAATDKSSSGKVTPITSKPEKKVEQTVSDLLTEDVYRERYIPITRRSIVRHLIAEKDFLTQDEKKFFTDFAVALDSAIVNRYHGVLQEVKTLFDPINPDKDTMQTRKWNRRERLDNEFWLIQKLEDVLERANFHELPKNVVQKALEEHEVNEGVRVSIDADKYDILRFWALGKETPKEKLPWYQALFWKTFKVVPRSPDYFKRVVVALRLKKDDKLVLKCFKEIPVNALEKLLPDGRIKINSLDKSLIGISLGIGFISIVTKIVTILAEMNTNWVVILTGATCLTAVQSWTQYKNKRNKYLADLNRLLYYKNIANNQGLLALLVDRAEDESFKEALLVYAFLLTYRPAPSPSTDSKKDVISESGGLTEARLHKMIEEWIVKKTGTKIKVNSSEAVKLLQDFGILRKDENRYQVISVEAALRNLPPQPQSLIARATDADLAEGYDRDSFLETEEQYKKEDEKAKRYGWF
ncbi:hypothetical protein ACJMK2_009026 [Sinanodonta woodiana]|uniref:Transmembrane protein 143 n=1 Tax=Sinanodonta woodiana TaxID=1069815 RepID=A0ABD3VDA8_SINWO